MVQGTDILTRKILMFALVGAFAVQTWLVYTDPVGYESPPLTEKASRGQALWHAHNCQSCHQIYGFGGFLGPDLTNSVDQLAEERLAVVLTTGTEIMPAFELDADERDELRAFLVEVDRTGQGQVRAADVVPPRTLLENLFRGTEAPESPLLEHEQRGLTLLLDGNCIDCHLPNAASAFRSPDLTLMAGRLGRDGMAAILTTGVPGKAMPIFAHPVDDMDAIHAALERLERHGDAVRAGFENATGGTSSALFDLPWFEYPRPTPSSVTHPSTSNDS